MDSSNPVSSSSSSNNSGNSASAAAREILENDSVIGGNEADNREARRMTAEEVQRERRERTEAAEARRTGKKRQKHSNLRPGYPVRAMTEEQLRQMKVTQTCEFMNERRTVNRRIEGVPTQNSPYWNPNASGGGDAAHSVVDLRDYSAEELDQISKRKNEDMYFDVYEAEDYVELPPPTKEQRVQIQHDIDRIVLQVSEIRQGIRNAKGNYAAAIRRAKENRTIPPEEEQKNEESWQQLLKQLQEADTSRPRTDGEDPYSLIYADKKFALLGEDMKKFERHTIAKTLELEFRPRTLPQAPQWCVNELGLTRLLNGKYGLAFVYRKPIKPNLFEYRFRLPRVETDINPKLHGFAWDFNLHFSVRLKHPDPRATNTDLLKAASRGATLVFKTYHFTAKVPGLNEPEDEYAAVTRSEGKKKKKNKMTSATGVFTEKRAVSKPPVKGVHHIPQTGIASFTGTAATTSAASSNSNKSNENE